MDSIISVQDIYFSYEGEDEDDVQVLKGISLEIERGSFVAVVGPNGSGKSTFAKQLNALLLPQKGRVLAEGMDTADDSLLWDIRRTVGMVFQNPDNQLVSAVVEDDVAFGPENIGIPSEEIRARVDSALEAVGMSDFKKQAPHNLSGGQKQRVAIAGVVAMRPECIVLDEPTAMLDPNGRKDVLHTVRDLNEREGVTVILITHYMEEVIFADRVIVMDRGHVVMQGTPREIFSRVDELKKLRLAVPQVTELAWELKKAGVPIADGILTREELVEALCSLN